jgi:hypothetical protein
MNALIRSHTFFGKPYFEVLLNNETSKPKTVLKVFIDKYEINQGKDFRDEMKRKKSGLFQTKCCARSRMTTDKTSVILILKPFLI